MTKPKPKTSFFKIAIVDEHPIVRMGLLHLLSPESEFKICGEASDGPEAIALVEREGPDLLILEVSAGEGLTGIELTRALRARFPKLRILILSHHHESLHAERALRAGANGYIMKKESASQLLLAIRQVLRGHVYVSPTVNERLLQRIAADGKSKGPASIEALSNRELEIFQLIGKGYGTRQMADHLHISPKTIESHREHIREKLQLGSTFQLVQRAIHWVHQERGLDVPMDKHLA